jgi:hypothetical protein
VDRAFVAPSPARGGRTGARFHLLAAAQDVRLCVYSQALDLVAVQDLGPQPGGWDQAVLSLEGLPPQAYVLVVRVRQGADAQGSRPVLFYRLP